jgi:hypothetical protein
MLTALCLVDGNVLNEDFDLYLSITGEREKRIGLGPTATVSTVHVRCLSSQIPSAYGSSTAFPP